MRIIVYILKTAFARKQYSTTRQRCWKRLYLAYDMPQRDIDRFHRSHMQVDCTLFNITH